MENTKLTGYSVLGNHGEFTGAVIFAEACEPFTHAAVTTSYLLVGGRVVGIAIVQPMGLDVFYRPAREYAILPKGTPVEL